MNEDFPVEFRVGDLIIEIPFGLAISRGCLRSDSKYSEKLKYYLACCTDGPVIRGSTYGDENCYISIITDMQEDDLARYPYYTVHRMFLIEAGPRRIRPFYQVGVFNAQCFVKVAHIVNYFNTKLF